MQSRPEHEISMTIVYYDLSEQFLASAVKFRYYGIVRTVMEVGYELAQTSADVRYVVFSPGHGRFFEVNPRFGAESPTGICDPNLPQAAQPIRVRYSFPSPHRLRDTIYPLVRWVVRKMCLRRWQAIPEGAVSEVDLSGQVLVSLGRSKMMADYLLALKETGVQIVFYPLVHDMIPLHEYMHNRQSKFSLKYAHDSSIVIATAHKVLTNSTFTKGEVLAFSKLGYLPNPLPDIVAVPLSHEFRPTHEIVETRPPTENYILCVGILRGRKNLECVLQAMLLLHASGRSVPRLVIAGAQRKRTNSYLKEPQFDAIRDRVDIFLNPNQAELCALYENTVALVIPSRMEGWGLPLGEALWLGTPGLSATAGALIEVGGDLAEYFDPDDPATLADLVHNLNTNEKVLQTARARLRHARPSLRSWKDVAHDVLAAID